MNKENESGTRLNFSEQSVLSKRSVHCYCFKHNRTTNIGLLSKQSTNFLWVVYNHFFRLYPLYPGFFNPFCSLNTMINNLRDASSTVSPLRIHWAEDIAIYNKHTMKTKIINCCFLCCYVSLKKNNIQKKMISYLSYIRFYIYPVTLGKAWLKTLCSFLICIIV